MRSSVLLIFAASLLGCSSENGTQTSPADSPPTSAAVVQEPSSDQPDSGKGAESGVFVIDVRSAEEWDSGHIEQAVHIPHTEIAERIGEVTDNKDAKIVVYCAVGGRAGRAKAALEERGFTNVENGGGFDDVRQRFPATEPNQESP